MVYKDGQDHPFLLSLIGRFQTSQVSFPQAFPSDFLIRNFSIASSSYQSFYLGSSVSLLMRHSFLLSLLGGSQVFPNTGAAWWYRWMHLFAVLEAWLFNTPRAPFRVKTNSGVAWGGLWADSGFKSRRFDHGDSGQTDSSHLDSS